MESDDISAETMKSISISTLTSYIKVLNYGTIAEGDGNVRYVDLEFHFNWKRIPIFCITDMVAIGFSSDTANKYMFKKVNGYNSKYTLLPLANRNSFNMSSEWNPGDDKPNSIAASLTLALKDSKGNLTHMCWSGTGKFRLTNRNFNSRLFVDAAYGHTTLNIVPDYSINANGLESHINFRVGMDEQHNCGYYYTNFKVDTSYAYEGNLYGL